MRSGQGRVKELETRFPPDGLVPMTVIKMPLPEDVETLQAMVRKLAARDEEKTARIAELTSDKERLEGLIAVAGCTMRRRKSLENFHRIVEVMEPELPPCPEGLEVVQIGVDTEELLDFDGTGFFVREVHRPKYVFRKIEVAVTNPEKVRKAGRIAAEKAAEPGKAKVVPIDVNKRPKH